MAAASSSKKSLRRVPHVPQRHDRRAVPEKLLQPGQQHARHHRVHGKCVPRVVRTPQLRSYGVQGLAGATTLTGTSVVTGPENVTLQPRAAWARNWCVSPTVYKVKESEATRDRGSATVQVEVPMLADPGMVRHADSEFTRPS
jgi:hypothetical protein